MLAKGEDKTIYPPLSAFSGFNQGSRDHPESDSASVGGGLLGELVEKIAAPHLVSSADGYQHGKEDRFTRVTYTDAHSGDTDQLVQLRDQTDRRLAQSFNRKQEVAWQDTHLAEIIALGE